MKMSKLAQASLFLGATYLTSSNVYAQASQKQLDNVVQAGQEINQSAANSQQTINKMADQIQSKLQQFKAVNKEIDGLDVYIGQMQKQVDNQMAEIAQLAESMEQVSIIERQVSPLMARMIETLAAFVDLDVPFLPEERSKRINSLKSMMERADIAVSEKFRRVLEAYQVEVDYGRTIEAYSDILMLDGSEMDVDFLRIGRVAFIYQTRDGSRIGLWSNEKGAWEDLDSSYRTNINKALRIARKQLAPDLVIVPVNVSE
jgi:vacuolar-type H+-ATPase subunit I/STV1